MRGLAWWTRRVLVGGIAVSLALVGAIYAASERRLRQRYDTKVPSVAVRTDDPSIARGEHLVRAITSCTLCHGEDLGGRVYSSSAAIGTVAGPNLTRGRGGIGAELTPVDVARALRRGVRRDGRSLIVMPSEIFTYLSEQDLAAIVAYVGRVPPVDREVPRTHFGPVGRTLLALGKLNILVAGKTPHVTAPDSVSPNSPLEYGRYLADIAGCRGCHGAELSGGRVAGPPGLPPASNLTTTGIGDWTEADFARAMRQGRRPDGSALDPFMPWEVFGKMNDAELHALWVYLRSMPPRAFGDKHAKKE